MINIIPYKFIQMDYMKLELFVQINLKANKMKSKNCSTLGDLKKILSQLIEANDPLDKDLINFYTKKIEVETTKALRKIEAKKMLLKN